MKTLVMMLALFTATTVARAQLVFAPHQIWPTTVNAPRSLALGDFDLDGDLDVAVTAVGGTTVLVNDGGGGLATKIVIGATGHKIAVADLDGDGWLDLVVANTNQEAVKFVPGSGSGPAGPLFGPVLTHYLSISNGVTGLDLGDVDEDGDPDIVTCGAAGDKVVIIGNGTVNGTFAFGSETILDPHPNSNGSNPRGLRATDLDADGHLDIVVANSGPSTVTAFYNDSNSPGTFPAVASIIAYPASVAWDVEVADLDADALPDFVTANHQGSATRGLQTATGSFSSQSTFGDFGANPAAVALGDLNGDGYSDAVTSNETSNGSKTLTWMINDGAGGLLSPTSVRIVGNSARDVALGDLNGDGRLDAIACGNTSSGAVGVLINLTPPAIPYPGAGQDLRLEIGIGGTTPTAMPIAAVPPSSLIEIRTVSPGGTHDLQPYALIADLFPTGAPAPGTGAFGIWVGPAPAILIDGFAAPSPVAPVIIPGGSSLHAVHADPALAGLSVILQSLGLVLAPVPQLSITDGVELRLL